VCRWCRIKKTNDLLSALNHKTRPLTAFPYERGSLIVTTNKAYKHWPSIFNNDAGITAAILDRLLHRANTVVLEGQALPHEGPPGRRIRRLIQPAAVVPNASTPRCTNR